MSEKLKYYQQTGSTKPKFPAQKSNYIADELNAELLSENDPPVYVIQKVIPLHFTYAGLIGADHKNIKIPLTTKQEFPNLINAEELLFFDLETTGLAGGSGVYPFLIGFGFIENSNFILRQYFLPEFDREIFVFRDLADRFSTKNTLVTFNGKSYDYPLLKSRFILNRFVNIFEKFAHLDLIHPARRLWKSSIIDCSLGNIEKTIFHFSRHLDIDGYMIPESYFRFIQTGTTEYINRIISHNQQDIISMFNILIYLANAENKSNSVKLKNSEFAALTKLAIRQNKLKDSGIYMEKLQKNPDDLILEFSLLLKKNNKFEAAVEIWLELLDKNFNVLVVLEELAKYYEHRKKDISTALLYCGRAIKYLDLLDELGTRHSDHISYHSSFNHRIKRLTLKQRR